MKRRLSFLVALICATTALWADDVQNFNVYADCSKNGYVARIDAVDLGLPSGIKWASCNVGATNPEDLGNYYAWGEVVPKYYYYSWSTYKYANDSFNKLTKYCNDADYGNNGFTDNKTTLDLEDDAAHVNWGGTWRMPTYTEIGELLNNCTWTWTTQNGVTGYKVTSKTNSNSIFLPAAGYRDGTNTSSVGSSGSYWSSSLYERRPYYARGLYFYSGYRCSSDYTRVDGYSVRPVCP